MPARHPHSVVTRGRDYVDSDDEVRLIFISPGFVADFCFSCSVRTGKNLMSTHLSSHLLVAFLGDSPIRILMMKNEKSSTSQLSHPWSSLERLGGTLCFLHILRLPHSTHSLSLRHSVKMQLRLLLLIFDSCSELRTIGSLSSTSHASLVISSTRKRGIVCNRV